MSEPSAPGALVQRLAVDRLFAPGVLDRRTLQRAHERFVPPASAQFIDRLHRRRAPAAPSTESLPLVRAQRSSEPDAASSPMAVDAGARPASRWSDRVGDAALGGPSSIATGVVGARQALRVMRAGELVTRRVADAPGHAARGHVASLQLQRSVLPADTSPGARPSVAAGTVAKGVIQRVAESRDVGRASAAGEPARVTTDASPLAGAVMMPVAMPGASLTPNAQAPTNGASRGLVATRALPRASVPDVTRATRPLVWRNADATTQIAAGSAPLVSPARPTVAAASTPLLLRKPDATARAARSATRAPSITTAAADVIARTAAAPASMPTAHGSYAHDAEPGKGGWTSGEEWNVDWLAEQVGQRLARRLEVERERMGVRQWRS